ncbi:MAG: DUF1566 domain-containing protein [Saprospiraceae bacterium]|nr:DUF1566 domain-containing protein [Saprospiraceae bacterium]
MKNALVLLLIIMKFIISVSAQNDGTAINQTGNQADLSAILDIQATDKGFLAPSMTEAQRDLIASPATSLLIFQIDGTPGFYYYTGNCWQLLGDTTPCVSPITYTIGDLGPAGGIIFYLAPNTTTDLDGDGTPDIGLECAPVNQSSGAPWGCWSTFISGAAATGIGSGATNTAAILLGCAAANIAADICTNLSLGGYSDWFLPSRDELDLMYQRRTIINATAIANGGSSLASGYYNYYWTSTQTGSKNAWRRRFYNGDHFSANKNFSYFVRAVRAF